MRVAFVGKGGSGKTTIAALMARHLAANNLPVLAIDADINQHLADGLGETTSLRQGALSDRLDELKTYLRGANPRIKSNKVMVKTTPPGNGSNLIHFGQTNPLLDSLIKNINGVDFLAAGTIGEEDVGIRCYHTKTGAVELFLSHLIDGEKEYVIVDMTAGADAFASGLFTKFDVLFLVAEPTKKSLSVYEQYKKYCEEYGIALKVIANKIKNPDDEAYVRDAIGNNLAAIFYSSKYIAAAERGEFRPINELEMENADALKTLVSIIDTQTRDWQRLYEQALQFHIKNAQSWANVSVGEDVTAQIDPEFLYIKKVEEMLNH